MSDVKEKLIELLNEAEKKCKGTICNRCEYCDLGSNCYGSFVADYLIAHGITIMTEVNRGG